jgi:hypothetical protein
VVRPLLELWEPDRQLVRYLVDTWRPTLSIRRSFADPDLSGHQLDDLERIAYSLLAGEGHITLLEWPRPLKVGRRWYHERIT